MASPACANCSNTPQQSDNSQGARDDNDPLSLPVILGVLGGMALVSLVVLLIVPLMRRRRYKQGYRYPGDVEDSISAYSSRFRPGSLLSYIGRSKHQPPVRHQYKTPGPDALLPLTLPTVSTFTWSDMRSPRASIDTDEEEDVDRFDADSFPTDHATMSHRSEYDQRQANSVRSGVSNSNLNAHRVRASAARGLPFPQRSPSPPGLVPHAPSPVKHKQAFQAAPISSHPLSTTFSPHPTVLFDADAEMSSSRYDNVPMSSKAGYFSRPENGMVSGRHPEGSSRPGSIQLPSPPDSPPFPAQSRADPQPGSHVRSRSTRSYSQTSQQGPLDYRFNPSRLRPHLSNSQSAPNALPFRPVSSSTSVQPTSPAHHAVPSSSRTTTSPPQLTSAFRHPVVSDTPSGSSSSASASGAMPYPAISTSPPSAMRSRSGSIASVASERPMRSATESRLRPEHMLRRASMSTHAVPPASPMGPRSPPTTPRSAADGTPWGTDTRSSSRAYLRTPDAHHHNPQYEEARVPQAQSTTSLLPDADLRGRSRAAVASTSSLSQTLYNPERPSFSHMRSASRQSSRAPSTAPSAYVKKKDSPALRPLSSSPFVLSPPQSPPGRHRSGTTSGVASPYITASRSRAGSIMTLGEPPREASEGSGSIHDSDDGASVDRRRTSLRSTLPPFQPMAPLDFDSLSDSYSRSMNLGRDR
ncbi:hypothetical protein EIP91_001259 [Steccherinum ochraceum]|uniref:Uncharacterized protein n=1 Tax=Steccherinum ochraceum TaxID=92696 RepID=A0A4R0RRR7_9APHY|nr:hypothetical protein EIP91_001259 [Steccherinum ochraceum]